MFKTHQYTQTWVDQSLYWPVRYKFVLCYTKNCLQQHPSVILEQSMLYIKKNCSHGRIKLLTDTQLQRHLHSLLLLQMSSPRQLLHGTKEQLWSSWSPGIRRTSSLLNWQAHLEQNSITCYCGQRQTTFQTTAGPPMKSKSSILNSVLIQISLLTATEFAISAFCCHI